MQHAIAAGAAEEVDALDRRQPLPEDVQQPLQRRRSRAARIAPRPGALQRLFDVARQAGVGILPRPPELLDQRIVGPGVDVVGGKHAGVAAGAFDFRLQPLEVLARVRRVGQHVDGLLERQAPELLQPPPRADAQVGRVRRELVDEQQPAASASRPGCGDGQRISVGALGHGWARYAVTL